MRLSHAIPLFMAVATAAAVDIGDRRQVVWDRSLLEVCEGVQFEMGQALRTGEADLVADKPWEAWMTGIYGTVIREGALFRMWYSARVSIGEEYVAYAESDDGLHWRKPALGLVAFRGSKANNLITPPDFRPHGVSVWADPQAPAGERYKLLYAQYPAHGGKEKAFLTQAASPDGIHFTFTGHSILDARQGEKGVAFDTHNVCFWDPSLKQYSLYTRARPGRSIGRAVSGDPMNFPLPQKIIEPEKVEDADYYSPGVFRYAEAEHAYVALVPVFYHPMDKAKPAEGQPMITFQYAGKPMEVPPPDSIDVHLFTSRDGIAWAPQGGHRPVMPLGPDGAFDSRQIYPFVNYVAVGDEIWIYYLGFPVTHDQVLPEKKQGTVSRAVFRRDGFMSATAGHEGATLVTRPLTFSGARLELNVDCSAGGRLDLDILGEDSRPLPGFSADRVYYNSPRKVVTFRGHEDLFSLAGKIIRLRFKMRDCRLYAFQFR